MEETDHAYATPPDPLTITAPNAQLSPQGDVRASVLARGNVDEKSAYCGVYTGLPSGPVIPDHWLRTMAFTGSGSAT